MKPPKGEPRVLFVLTTEHTAWAAVLAVTLGLCSFVLHTYYEVYNPRFGWTKMTFYGADFVRGSLPRLQRLTHYVEPTPSASSGYDGQFYAQMAIDPSLRDPAFDHALDIPIYRARRIGLPALSFCLGGGKPRRIIQAYALSNLLFWFVLFAALSTLLKPRSVQPLLCLSASMLGVGVLFSMERSLTDLPAAAIMFAGTVIGSWGGYAAFAAAGLTRETSVLVALGFLGRPRRGVWLRQSGELCLAFVPLIVWMIYVGHRFHRDLTAADGGSFSWPFGAMTARLADAIRLCANRPATGFVPLTWLYQDTDVHEVLTIGAIICQSLYLIVRRDLGSPFWRTGICYVVLASVLGEAVWQQSASAARVLLPMTLCFYLLLARERAVWFWPFFVLGSLAIPWSVYDFWTMT